MDSDADNSDGDKEEDDPFESSAEPDDIKKAFSCLQKESSNPDAVKACTDELMTGENILKYKEDSDSLESDVEKCLVKKGLDKKEAKQLSDAVGDMMDEYKFEDVIVALLEEAEEKKLAATSDDCGEKEKLHFSATFVTLLLFLKIRKSECTTYKFKIQENRSLSFHKKNSWT